MPVQQLRFAEVPLERNPETGAPSAAYAAWVDTAWEGFHEKPATAQQLEQLLQAEVCDGRVLRGVFDDSRPTDLVDALTPVATYASFTRTMNLGAKLLPAHLITMVTVRPTHRRRGILRKLLSTDLSRAKDAGFALAVLTATEATIYGRFGFGRATEQQVLELDVRGAVDFHAAATGSVVQLVPAKLADIAPELFARFHESQRGSIGRQESYTRMATGAWGDEQPEPDTKLRAAVYLDAHGVIQGYVTYAFAGWESTPPTLKVRDLVAATAQARRELLRFLANLDLVERVTVPMVAANDPLTWALVDPSRISYTQRQHGLWVRVLDVVAAFEAREYRGSGTFTLQVQDPLSLVAGTYRFTLTEGNASISLLEHPEPADASCEVTALGPLLLGACTVTDLVVAGLLKPASPAASATLGSLLDLPGLPHAINGF